MKRHKILFAIIARADAIVEDPNRMASLSKGLDIDPEATAFTKLIAAVAQQELIDQAAIPDDERDRDLEAVKTLIDFT